MNKADIKVTIRSVLLPVAGALGLALAATHDAHAVLQLSYTITDLTTAATSSATIVDGGAGDESVPGGSSFPDGILVLANNTTILSKLIVNGSTSQALGTPVLPAPLTVLSSGSSSVTNNSGDPMRIMVAVGATDFSLGRKLASVTGSGTFQLTPGTTINLGWYDDPTNTQGANSATDAPGNKIDAFTFTSTTNLDSFSVNADPFSVDDPNPFSMTMTFDFTLQPGGSLISRGQSEIKEVPEPASLGLLACAIAGLGVFGRPKSRARPG